MMLNSTFRLPLAAALLSLGLLAGADSPATAAPLTEAARTLLDDYASRIDGFDGWSAEAGRTLYFSEHPGDERPLACATCHGESPSGPTEHHRTGKRYGALDPDTNPKRFTDAYEIEKWFTRNCQTVLNRACTPQEKGDFITWLFQP